MADTRTSDTVTFDDVQSDRLCSAIVKMIRRLEALPVKSGIREISLESLRMNLKTAIYNLLAGDENTAEREELAAHFYDMENVGDVRGDIIRDNVGGSDSGSLNAVTRSNLLKLSRELGKFNLSVVVDIWRVICNFNEILDDGAVREKLVSCDAPEFVKDNVAFRYFSLLYAVRMEYGYGYLEAMPGTANPDELDSITEEDSEAIEASWKEHAEESDAVTDFIYAYLSR